MFGEEPPIAPPPPLIPVAPSPRVAPSPNVARNPRYVYLVGRLQMRQITMEEATELFQIQQAMIRQAANQLAASTATSMASPSTATPGPTSSTSLVLDDESLALGLLLLGTGAGMLAAMMKRSGLVPPPSAQSDERR